jgi:hypothetical protein
LRTGNSTAITWEVGFGESIVHAGKDEVTGLGVVTGAIQSASVGGGTAVAAPDVTAKGFLEGDYIFGILITIGADAGSDEGTELGALFGAIRPAGVVADRTTLGLLTGMGDLVA